MNAIEFRTVVKDAMIHIPRHQMLENKQVRVIILDETGISDDKNVKSTPSLDALFDRYHLEVGTFDREEAHAR